MEDDSRDAVIVDVDEDGIPDDSEKEGTTYNGLPLYDWGARTDQKDIFIHINYMESDNPAIKPRKEALDKVREVFEEHGFFIHFDTGDLYHQAEGANPGSYDLDDRSHEVYFSYYVTLGEESGKADLYDYKSLFLTSDKKQIFHYLLMAHAHNEYGCSGLAEYPGNDFIVSLGQWGLEDNTDDQCTKLINYQAATIMHELGHNLGLRHGGFENTNNKPNYVSVMNYQYHLRGIPTIGDEREGDRYYWDAAFVNYFLPSKSKKELHNGPYSETFVIDYSDGSSGNIDENNINEHRGLGRSLSNGVDFNGNYNNNDTGIAVDTNGDGSYGVLKDYNDWANIKLFFYRGSPGGGGFDNPFNPVGDDQQEASVENKTFADDENLE